MCLFTSRGDLSVQSLRGTCSIPTAGLSLSSFQLAWLQQRSQGYLLHCQRLGSSYQAPPVKGWPLALCTWADSAV